MQSLLLVSPESFNMQFYELKGEHIAIEYGDIPIEKGDRSIKSVITAAKELGVFAQVVTAKAVISNFQCLAAFEQAKNAISNKTAFSKTLELEYLLRLIGSTQLEEVFKLLELKEGMNKVAIICAASSKEKVKDFIGRLSKEMGFKAFSNSHTPDLKFIGSILNIDEKSLESFSGNSKTEKMENALLERIAIIELSR